jgi:polyisoprenoid-binding protein YceI
MTKSDFLRPVSLGICLMSWGMLAQAAETTYEIDSAHTYPAFEADHLGGVSLWRGKITSTSGTIVLDKEMGTGAVDITMDMSSIDFGHDGLSTHAKSSDMFDVERFPTATYSGRLSDFRDGRPTSVEGTLTLHGVTQPVDLDIDHFLCKPHPMQDREVCGANATTVIDRSDFGVDYGAPLFLMDVTLRISVEALAAAEE